MASDTDAVINAAEQLVEQARRLLEGQIEELTGEAKKLERAAGHLGASPSPKPPKRPKAKATRQRKRSREYWEKKIIDELHKRPGTIRDLSKRLGLKPGATTLFGPAKALLDAKRVVKKGAVYLLPPEKPEAKPRRRAAAKSKGAKSKKASR